ncbi:major facilitator superfamily domain-containing protein [Halteromyces radiatus]|uniref:major facilitator superfamily domain-containing protein n=1 Tax=Halteromyces radiatus TaxID=101107 RepID=UPI00221F39A5|nr:major facilitator superfamily domain-containing protein [Halteromyces radiatus]KAI8081601.1 major facilitator superfamily domain-containing protein [Halteromyces radiatus]
MSRNDNTWFIGLKLLSVFSIGCIGSSMLYLPTFYKNVLNLSTDKIGFLYSITPFVSCLSFPFWTSYLDRTQAYKTVMITNMAVSTVSVLFIAIVPYLTNEMGMTMMLVTLGCFGFSWFGYPVIAAMVDSVTFLVLGDYKELYGQQKTGCPVGYGLSVFLTGLLMESIGPYAMFPVYTFFSLSFIITVALLDFTPRKKSPCLYDDIDSSSPTLLTSTTQINNTPKNSSISSSDSSTNGYGSVDTINNDMDVDIEDDDDDDEVDRKQQTLSSVSMWSLLANPESCLFFLVTILMGFSIAVIQAFLFLFMRNDLHASPSMIGLLGPLGSSTEIVCFYFSKQIFTRIGPNRMLMVAQWITIFRCFIYILTMGLENQGAWVATITQLLHGIGFSMMWSAAALQAERIAPDHLKNSAQGLLNMCFNGIGGGLGAICGGLIYDTLGAKIMWLSVICLMLFSFFIYTSSWVKRTFLLTNSSFRRF